MHHNQDPFLNGLNWKPEGIVCVCAWFVSEETPFLYGLKGSLWPNQHDVAYSRTCIAMICQKMLDIAKAMKTLAQVERLF